MFSYLSRRLKAVHPLLSSKTTIRQLSKMTPTATPLTELRKLMAENGVSAYFIPSEDAHQVKLN